MAKKPEVDREGIEKLAERLFVDERERREFVDALVRGDSREGSLILLQEHPAIRTFPYLPRVPWQPDFVLRLGEGFKPGNHALYEKGAFYSLDLSSVFSATAMLALARPPVRVLDLCAAPGGKSVFAAKAFRPEAIIANEIIRKRTGLLINNLERCRIDGAQVTILDPGALAAACPASFDFVIVDAPCSGQSLVAKGEETPGSFSGRLVKMNAQRQRRILANAAQVVAPGGAILYATCTFAPEENEETVAWLLERFPELSPIPAAALEAHASPLGPGYRLYPQSGLGAGAYVCLLVRSGEPAELPALPDLKPLWKSGDVRIPKTKPATEGAAGEKKSEKKGAPKSRGPRGGSPARKPKTFGRPPRRNSRRGR